MSSSSPRGVADRVKEQAHALSEAAVVLAESTADGEEQQQQRMLDKNDDDRQQTGSAALLYNNSAWDAKRFDKLSWRGVESCEAKMASRHSVALELKQRAEQLDADIERELEMAQILRQQGWVQQQRPHFDITHATTTLSSQGLQHVLDAKQTELDEVKIRADELNKIVEDLVKSKAVAAAAAEANSIPLPTSREEFLAVCNRAPDAWIESHTAFGDRLLQSFDQAHLDDFCASRLLTHRRLIETEIRNLIASAASRVEGEEAAERSQLGVALNQERFLLTQDFRTSCVQELERARSAYIQLNSTGSELQRSLGAKRDDLQRARGMLAIARENLEANRQQKQVNAAVVAEEDDTIAQLNALQDEFAALQEELYLRPTLEESNLQGLRDQILNLAQELAEKQQLLSMSNNVDSALQSQHGYVAVLRRLNDEISSRKRSRDELTARIDEARRNIEENTQRLAELNIDERRQRYAERQKSLADEIDALRDKLHSAHGYGDDDDDDDTRHVDF